MKYVIVLADGMADLPLEELGGKTPLEYANTPTMDQLAPQSEIGLLHTIPKGMKPGSDTANLSVLGYDPKQYYTGRSPLEALSIGVDMKDTDIAFRCNLVTLSEEEADYGKKRILDHSSGEISTEEAALLIEAAREAFENDPYHFYVGTSYRHLLIQEHGAVVELAQPHDILEQVIGEYLPEDPMLRRMMEESYALLNSHPVNAARRQKGLNPANSLWFWGAGTRPRLSSFEEKNRKKGVMISAVDLLKGIAVGAGMENISVEGANGGLDTNYEGKADAAIKALCEEGYDFAYIHVEAPDEMGHQGSAQKKVQSIEYIDERVVRRLTEAFGRAGEDYRLLILPDHPTPVSVRTHTDSPVPYLLYDSTDDSQRGQAYGERAAKESGIVIGSGFQMIDRLFGKATVCPAPGRSVSQHSPGTQPGSDR